MAKSVLLPRSTSAASDTLRNSCRGYPNPSAREYGVYARSARLFIAAAANERFWTSTPSYSAMKFSTAADTCA